MILEKKLYKILRNNLNADQAKYVCDRVSVGTKNAIDEIFNLMEQAQQEVVIVKTNRDCDLEAEDLAEKLNNYVVAKYPFLERNYKPLEWAIQIQRIHKRGYSYALIEAVMKWVFEESDFWSRNIRSATKFNKQFEVNLLPQVKDEYEKSKVFEI